MNKVGRPTMYNEELADEICESIENTVFGLEDLCKQKNYWPVRRTIVRWLREKPEFNLKYEKAKENQADFTSDEIVRVAYDDKKDHRVIVDDEGNEKTIVVSEAVNRSRLKVDALKWRAIALNRKKYGDKKEEKDESNESLRKEMSELKEELKQCRKTS